MEGQPNNSLEARVAKIEGQLATLVSTVKDFITGSENWRNEVSRDFKVITRDHRPNFGIMAAWAAVILSIIAAVGAPIQLAARRDSDRHEKGIEQLDTKLQREFQLMADTLTQAVQNLNNISKERHERVNDEVNKTWDWIKWQTQSDLEELRQRRLKDAMPSMVPQSSIQKPTTTPRIGTSGY